jgi:hypothetical protein
MQGPLPGSTGIGQAANTLLGIPNMQKVFSLAKTIAHFSRNSEGALIAMGGFRVPTEPVLDIAEAIPCLGFATEVAKHAVQD